ncbi:hypothetical protein R50073_33470 [Maricurvus nonylphenolicus]
MFTAWALPKGVVETENALDIGTAKAEGLAQRLDGFFGHITKVMLEGVQYRQQGAFKRLVFCNDGLDARLADGCGHGYLPKTVTFNNS